MPYTKKLLPPRERATRELAAADGRGGPAARREEELAAGPPVQFRRKACHETRRLARPLRVGLQSALPRRWEPDPRVLLTQQPACRQIPARESSVWYPGIYPGRLSFTTEYPERPPTFKFLPIDGKPLFHPNVFNDGKICMSIINPPESMHAYGKGGNWSVSVTIKQARGTGRFATPSAASPCPPARLVRRRRSSRRCRCSWTSRLAALRGEKRPTICTTTTAPSTTSA